MSCPSDLLYRYFRDVPEEQRALAYDTIDEYLLLKKRMDELSKLPYIRIDKKNPQRQQLTPAAKLLKEYSQAVDNKRKVLLMILYRVETSAADELLRKLEEFA